MFVAAEANIEREERGVTVLDLTKAKADRDVSGDAVTR